jgi:predicted dehydrogenase
MKVINTALLSYGASGKLFHAPFIAQHKGFHLRGAWERTRRQIGNDYTGAGSYSSLKSLLGDPEVGLVVVNTPTYTHFDFARQALEAGKHVLVEKAFTTTTQEAETLIQLAARRNRILAVYQNRRYDSDFRSVASVVNSGALGRLHTATFTFHRFRPDIGPKEHFENPGPGAGILNDLGPHLIDQALTLFGVPQRVWAELRMQRPGSLVDDCFELQLQYADGLRVRLEAGMMITRPQPAYILHGTDGSFIKERSDRQETMLRAGARPDYEGWYTEPESDAGSLYSRSATGDAVRTIPGERGNYMVFYENLYRSILGNFPPPVSGYDGLQVMRVIEAARMSHNTGCAVGLNPG